MLGPILSAAKGGAVVAGNACCGPCNRRWREAWEDYKQALALYDPLDKDQSRPQPPEVTPVEGIPVWCGRCGSTIRAQLCELDDLAPLRLETADGYDSAPGEQRVGGTRDQGSPSQASDDVDEVLSMLTGWEDAWREANGWRAAQRRGFLARKRTTVIDWLTDQLDDILISPLAKDFGGEVMAAHRGLKGSAKAGARKLPKPLRCPSCKLLTLIWDEEKPDVVACGNRRDGCTVIMSWAEYEATVAAKASAA
jgi:hypothetical protein